MKQAFLAGTALLALVAAALAEEGAGPKDPRQVAGHEVTVTDTDDFMQELRVDGQVVLEDGLILLDQELTVAGMPVLTGVSGPGGNACDAAPFVLSLPEGQAARLDGPIDTCSFMALEPGPEALIWSSEPLPDLPGEVWTWTPAAGFAPGADQAFAPDTTEGWGDLAVLDRAHPVEALKVAPVYAALTEGLPPAEWETLSRILSGLGSGGLVAQGYRGEACTKLVCQTEFAILWLDRDRQQVFAFWREDGDATDHMFPADNSQWPQWVRDDLAARLAQ